MGRDYNWKMVFGKNKALWFLPITTGGGAPLGDGVVINKIETSFSAMKDLESGKKLRNSSFLRVNGELIPENSHQP